MLSARAILSSIMSNLSFRKTEKQSEPIYIYIAGMHERLSSCTIVIEFAML